MRSLICCVLLVFASQTYADSWPVWPQLQTVQAKLGWQVYSEQLIGHATRVRVYGGQDPFPFCAAVAASILHDQHECMQAKKDCYNQPRTSALSLVDASQATPGKINWDNGGNSLLALNKLVANSGAAAHVSCNYDSITNPRKNKGIDFVRIYGDYASYRQTQKWGGYLQRYYYDEFVWETKQLGLYKQNLDLVLTKPLNSPHDLAAALILDDSCYKITIHSAKSYTVKILDNPVQDIELLYIKIQQLLKNKTPVGVNLCLNIDAGFKACSKHSLVIFAEAYAKNAITGDTRQVYQIVNTWSEQWHKDHAQGWIFADQLLLGIYSIFWLE